jgi:hypothetical protein
MSVDALLKLRDDIGTVLRKRSDELQSQLSRLGGSITKWAQAPRERAQGPQGADQVSRQVGKHLVRTGCAAQVDDGCDQGRREAR